MVEDLGAEVQIPFAADDQLADGGPAGHQVGAIAWLDDACGQSLLNLQLVNFLRRHLSVDSQGENNHQTERQEHFLGFFHRFPPLPGTLSPGAPEILDDNY